MIDHEYTKKDFSHLKKIESEQEFLEQEKKYMRRLTMMCMPRQILKILSNPKRFNDEFIGLFDEMEYIGLITDEDREKYVMMYVRGLNMPQNMKVKLIQKFKDMKGSNKKKIKTLSEDVQDYLKEN